MSDNNISPQGYIYGSEPRSTNPFWDHNGGDAGKYVELEKYLPEATATYADILEHAHLGLPVEITPYLSGGIEFEVLGGSGIIKEKDLYFDNQQTPYSMSMHDRTNNIIRLMGFHGYISNIYQDESDPSKKWITCKGSMVIDGWKTYNVADATMAIYEDSSGRLIFALCAGTMMFSENGSEPVWPEPMEAIDLPSCSGATLTYQLIVGTMKLDASLYSIHLLETIGAFAMYVPKEEQ